MLVVDDEHILLLIPTGSRDPSGHRFLLILRMNTGGGTLTEALENVGLCMFNYLTPLKGIEEKESRSYSAEGHDINSLVFHWLDELLFQFSTDFFVPRTLKITLLRRGNEEENGDHLLAAAANGASQDEWKEHTNRKKPASQDLEFATAAWRIEAKGTGEVFDRTRHASGTEIKAITYSAMQVNEIKDDAEVFVIVDI